MRILNLGCGTKTSNSNDIINIDWSILLRIKKNYILSKFIYFFLNNDRKKKLLEIPQNIVVHDLRKGIPFLEASVDAVYSSHVLEHIDRAFVSDFLKENYRVLKSQGLIRIVVPDLYYLCSQYVDNYNKCSELNSSSFSNNHDNFISEILEQSVRKEAFGSSKQNYIIRKIENLLLGDARNRGETHQWMYDRFNLQKILLDVGFRDIKIHTFLTSDIPEWNKFGLDQNDIGEEYKPNSLYIEARKLI